MRKKIQKERANRQAGFTLVELIIVIAIIAILAGAIFVAIDPARRLNETRNARRNSDVATILDAIKKYQGDNAGVHYATVVSMAADTYYQLGTASSGCGVTCGLNTTQTGCVDLSNIGTNYLAVVPLDPNGGTSAKTAYAIERDSNGAITIQACNAEGEGPGGAGSAPTISITR